MYVVKVLDNCLLTPGLDRITSALLYGQYSAYSLYFLIQALNVCCQTIREMFCFLPPALDRITGSVSHGQYGAYGL